MKRYSVLFIPLVLLGGCAKDDTEDEMVVVYESRNALQCESSGITPAESAAKLASVSVAVKDTACASKTGIAYPAACGMGNGEILIHEIAAEDLKAAQNIGFQPVSELINSEQKTGYDIVECKVVG